MNKIPFSKKFSKNNEKLIDDDFPESARIALSYIFADLNKKQFLENEESIYLEINRIGRFSEINTNAQLKSPFYNNILEAIQKLRWDQVYLLCERTYSKLLNEFDNDFMKIYVPLEDVQNYYSKEINQLICEENLGFNFLDGSFERKGRAQTQKAIDRVGTVLSDPRLEKVKYHFNKARNFFNQIPTPDLENCVKDSLCALEAALEVFTGKPSSNDFDIVVKQLERGNQIPSPIAQSIIKLHAYRGSATGVAHAALNGNRLTSAEAELVLSLVADYVTYLSNVFPPEEEIPF
jgi:hypothetical protein